MKYKSPGASCSGALFVSCYSCMYSIMKPGTTCTTVFGFQLGGSTLVSVTEPMVFGFHFGYSTFLQTVKMPGNAVFVRVAGHFSYSLGTVWKC